jgi:hypothetical protein
VRSKKALLALVLAGMTCGCGGQGERGSPRDPNEQQGNPKAKPEKSITSKPGKQPADDQAGKDAHTGLSDGAKRQ